MLARSLLELLTALQVVAAEGSPFDATVHAEHIFRALHNSMEQFGSVIQHNGMSIALAYVPAGTEFYHGSGFAEPPEGMQWLAFEPEHAMAFAHPHRRHAINRKANLDSNFNGPTTKRSDKCQDRQTNQIQGSDKHGKVGHEPAKSQHSDLRRYFHESRDGGRQEVLKSRTLAGPWQFLLNFFDRYLRKPGFIGRELHLHANLEDVTRHPTNHHDDIAPRYGYLHTYRTKHDLKLLYFDGQSAAKSIKGTLDTQDIVIRNASHFQGSPMAGDNVRAQDLCGIARERWGGRIDGFLRMVGGFEVILCSFSEHLYGVNVAAKEARHQNHDYETGLSYAQALATRQNGIGGGRVTIDYERFLSVLAFPEAVYFDDGLPRIHNSSDHLETVRQHIYALVLSDIQAGIDWQAVTDMIVDRYSYRIEHMLSSKITTHHALQLQLYLALEPFIDDTARNETAETERCAHQFWPSNANMSTIPAQAVWTVSRRVCSDLVYAANAKSSGEAVAVLEELKSYLDWAVFRRCKDCNVDEVCRLPIWPSGSKQDFIQPRCGPSLDHREGGYWDLMGKKRGPH